MVELWPFSVLQNTCCAFYCVDNVSRLVIYSRDMMLEFKVIGSFIRFTRLRDSSKFIIIIVLVSSVVLW